ncbi:MAG: Gfo/Idh/MocA family oxidoreductase [Candidatus Poribacteria bacterium]|nr:Gfo/Idh/MocA family oxidoreductase [Candidatus Poribacteria bacterium]
MSKLGIGFVGSDVHIGGYVKAFLAHPDVNLVGACDSEEGSAREVAAQGNMALTTTCYEELLENPEIDVIMVCSPDHFHAAHSISALRAGKHVLCEKPMTTTLQDCKDMVGAVDETGLTFMASQFMRFRPKHQAIKKLYDDGVLGRAFFVEGSYIHDMSSIYARNTWRSNPKNPQNILIGGGCHPLDLLRWAVGSEIQEVHAYSNGYAARDFVLDDCYIFSCKFEDGCLGKVLVTTGCKGHGMGEGFLSIYGTDATVWRDRLYPAEGQPTDIPSEELDPMQAIVGQFVDCVMTGKQPSIDVRDGAKTVSALVAGVESAQSGVPVTVFNDF